MTTIKTANSVSLDTFIDKLVEEKKFENVEPETLEQIKKDLMKRVEDRINAGILENMPPEKLEEFNNMLEKNTGEEIQKFVAENISNLEEVIAKELVAFRATYLGL